MCAELSWPSSFVDAVQQLTARSAVKLLLLRIFNGPHCGAVFLTRLCQAEALIDRGKNQSSV
jgi:hypothetical protein